jgi:hypothetical protein
MHIPADPSDDVAVLICALGSADKSFTVWSYNESTPVLIGKRFFKGQVGMTSGTVREQGTRVVLPE